VFGAAPTNAVGSLDQTFSPKWITDVSASFDVRRFTLNIGADNVLDIYPDRNKNNGVISSLASENGGTSNFGMFPYNGVSPFGFNGRFIYAKVAFGL
jgi:iron complex outermembrane receptor protein